MRFNREHQHGYLPDLKWVSPNNIELISSRVAGLAERHCWKVCSAISEPDQDLLSQIRDFDFRYIQLRMADLPSFASWLWEQVGLTTAWSSFLAEADEPIGPLQWCRTDRAQ